MLEKTYSSKLVQEKYYQTWENAHAFQSGNLQKNPYTIMMPPPNVTGSLHLGHALTFTLQDILIRYHRMKGYDALWQPGTDHAGIATQMVVERQLAEKGINRHDLGRGGFLKEIWAWKATSGNTILEQLKLLGASADWKRERFTMDDASNRAVNKVFVDLYKQGLIYRDQRLVNWDTHFQTAISDLEVDQREEEGTLWHLKYPVVGSDQFISVATTRPETFFGDTAVAVHPEDPRYQHLIGQKVRLPIIHREIPIIADLHSDPEKGSGAVKITPAHDFNDFSVGKRHNLPMINILTPTGRLNEHVPSAYEGKSIKEARLQVLEELTDLGLLEYQEKIMHAVPYGDRSGVVIEPYLTDQWFVDAEKLAGPAIEAVKSGRTTFVPKNWEKTYFEWMNNIEPWCISRQIWWGHQIPAWYGPDGTLFVAETEQEAEAQAQQHYGASVVLSRDPDVLDTWFSSAIWPFSTLGWPKNNPDLKRYYPTDVLVTGFDIIFFWVARMMMMGLHFMKDVPFKIVYIHALVRDAQGQKMSKSKGNIIDPREMIETYGADALRFALALLATPGRDIRMSQEKVESSRNFITKLWNAARYLQMNHCKYEKTFDPLKVQSPLNQWIIGELAQVTTKIETSLQQYHFAEVTQALYQFTWKTFCDWYIEFSKPILMREDSAAKQETQQCLGWVLGVLLHLLHPVVPYITEELWQELGGEGLLIQASWPMLQGVSFIEPQEEINWVIQLISELRSLRAEMNIAPSIKLKVIVDRPGPFTPLRLSRHRELLLSLGRLDAIEIADVSLENSKGCLQLIVGQEGMLVPIKGVIDIETEHLRLTKELQKVHQEMQVIMKRLGDEAFVSKAPTHIIEENQQRYAARQETQAHLQQALEKLRGL